MRGTARDGKETCTERICGQKDQKTFKMVQVINKFYWEIKKCVMTCLRIAYKMTWGKHHDNNYESQKSYETLGFCEDCEMKDHEKVQAPVASASTPNISRKLGEISYVNGFPQITCIGKSGNKQKSDNEKFLCRIET